MDIIEQVNSIIANAANEQKSVATEQKTSENALTLDLGFHKFSGEVSVKEVMEQIGADFNVHKEHLVRIPDSVYMQLVANRNANVDLNIASLIDSHCATVNSRDNSTLGIVGADYGVIQNSDGLNILDLLTNSSVSGQQLRIVSAGLVHNSDPYVQVEMPMGTGGLNKKVDNDYSDHKFYAFFHTSHDGSSGLKVSFSAVRVVCRNTFNANMRESDGFNVKHTKYAAERVDMSNEANIKRVQEIITKFNLFSQEYIDKMNLFSLQKIDDEYINKYIAKLFLPDEKTIALAKEYGYNFDNPNVNVSTRTKNSINRFRDVLESGVGQEAARGTKMSLWNATTNYFSNAVSFGSDKDTDQVRASKRFDSMMNGNAMRKTQVAYDMLALV